MPKSFQANINPGISIITLGTIGLLVANFLKSFTQSTMDPSIFNLSTFCLILSGIIVVYSESVLQRPTHFRHFSFFGKRIMKVLNVVSNTLFDLGVLLLLIGVSEIFVTQIESAQFVENHFLTLTVFIIFLLILNYRYERKF